MVDSSFLATTAIGIFVAVFPTVLAFLLPRKKSIQYGCMIYLAIDSTVHKIASKLAGSNVGAAAKIADTLGNTITDISFGIYIASEKLSKEERDKRIETYIKGA